MYVSDHAFSQRMLIRRFDRFSSGFFRISVSFVSWTALMCVFLSFATDDDIARLSSVGIHVSSSSVFIGPCRTKDSVRGLEASAAENYYVLALVLAVPCYFTFKLSGFVYTL